MAGAINYMPKGVPVSTIGYWRPDEGRRRRQRHDHRSSKGAKNPVLAHHFLNFLLDNKHGVENFSWIGYMPPLKVINPSKVIAQGYIPKNLGSTIVRESDFENGVTHPAAHDAGPGDLAGRVVDVQGRLARPEREDDPADLLAELRVPRRALARPALPRADLRRPGGRVRHRPIRSSRTRCRCGTRCTGSSTRCAASCTTCGRASRSSRSSCARSRTSASSLAGCLAIGYPVAYYLARYARRTKTLLLVLLIVPFWVSYLMRMLAWVGLLLPDGLVNRTLIDLGIISQPYGWLDGQASSVIFALIYGYIPYLILPLYATLDRIEPHVLEAGRDLGASPIRTFLHVTLPLSRYGILAASVLIALPMFGDYYTNDVISGSPQHDDDRQRDQPVLPGRPAAHGRRLPRDRAVGRSWPC